jgi:hypothetical protein
VSWLQRIPIFGRVVSSDTVGIPSGLPTTIPTPKPYVNLCVKFVQFRWMNILYVRTATPQIFMTVSSSRASQSIEIAVERWTVR